MEDNGTIVVRTGKKLHDKKLYFHIAKVTK